MATVPEVTVVGADHDLPSKTKTSPLASDEPATAAPTTQKVGDAHDTPPTMPSTPTGSDAVVDQEVPSQVRMVPVELAATQKVGDAHDTSWTLPDGSIVTGADHDVPS